MKYTVFTPFSILPALNNTVSFTVSTKQEAAQLARAMSKAAKTAVEVTRAPKPFPTQVYYLAV